MPEATLLLIDDDETLLGLLGDHLQHAGYRVLAAANGPAGLRLVEGALPDLVVLDVMMPGTDGWEICRLLRSRAAVPVIMLTAKGQEVDKLHGFNLGVDDYVTKPFSFAELTARIGAVLARARSGQDGVPLVKSGDLIVDLAKKRVVVRNEPVELTPTEFRLLETLVRRSGRTVPIETLLAEVWGPRYAGEVEHVKHYIWALRQKIEADPGHPDHVHTVRGFGYRFE